MTRRAAVLGSPVAHSLSPVLHRAAYAELGIDWSYEAFQVEADELPAFLRELGPEWAGLSLTMPLKRAVLPLLDWVTGVARAVHAANTLILAGGRRLGTNTDVPGMVAALAERGVTRARTATVLGGGATASSALAALGELGAKTPTVVVRRPSAADELQSVALGLGQRAEVRPWVDDGSLAEALCAELVVQTAPSGAADAFAAEVPARPGVLFDVVYDPWPTPLAQAWEEAGGVVVGGLDLLVHQAVLQVQLMTGRDAPADRLAACMREAGLAELSHRAGA